MSDRSRDDQDQHPGTEDPQQDREVQEEGTERAETVDGALSPGSTATESPTARGE